MYNNSRVIGADPLVKEGIGEEDMLTIVLPYIHSAREGVQRMGHLLEKYGTYEMNGIGFQDQEEIWWLESLGGHHWLAKRIIAAMADAHFAASAIHVERYQNATEAKGHYFLKEFDRRYLAEKPADAASYLEACNRQIADYAKEETDQLLSQILIVASDGMKNAFARSDA